MTAGWLCCDLPTAVADALRDDALDNLDGAEAVSDSDRAAAYELLRTADQRSAVAADLLRRLAPLVDPYPPARASGSVGSAHQPS
ncbi:MAG: hypothetical protein JWO12_293 [Frankiales bacterium]|nr:hypothetical protein [Frankiales bacterium]